MQKSTGELPAFPNSLEGTQGMTYRQWLIGMAICNGKIGMQAVETADMIVKILDKERDNGQK
jgi:hypothetical protein